MNDFFIKRHSKISQNTVWPVFSRVSILLGTHVCTMWRCRLVAAVGVVPASRVAMDTSSLPIAFGLLLTFKAPATKLIISDEFKWRSTWTKLLHDYQVVGWKYSACSFKNKIFIGIFGSTLHVFVVIVVVVFSLFPHPASYWSLVNDGKFCYCFVFMVIDPRCLVSRWNYLPYSKKFENFASAVQAKRDYYFQCGLTITWQSIFHIYLQIVFYRMITCA